ncbi:MAG: hypothetical protein ABEJ02_01765 [Candidatus Paceibacteria bacterium]
MEEDLRNRLGWQHSKDPYRHFSDNPISVMTYSEPNNGAEYSWTNVVRNILADPLGSNSETQPVVNWCSHFFEPDEWEEIMNYLDFEEYTIYISPVAYKNMKTHFREYLNSNSDITTINPPDLIRDHEDGILENEIDHKFGISELQEPSSIYKVNIVGRNIANAFKYDLENFYELKDSPNEGINRELFFNIAEGNISNLNPLNGKKQIESNVSAAIYEFIDFIDNNYGGNKSPFVLGLELTKKGENVTISDVNLNNKEGSDLVSMWHLDYDDLTSTRLFNLMQNYSNQEFRDLTQDENYIQRIKHYLPTFEKTPEDIDKFWKDLRRIKWHQ